MEKTMDEVIIERAVPTDKKLYSSVKSRIKKKYKVWPSAYGSAALVKAYKASGGGYRNVKETLQNAKYQLEAYATDCEDNIVELHFILGEEKKTQNRRSGISWKKSFYW